jgi:hypothetical protein
MDRIDTLQTFIDILNGGGTASVVTLLVVVIAIMAWERKELIKQLNKTTELVYGAKDSEAKSIKEIVDKYHQGNVNLIQALNEMKIVLGSIQNSRK